MAKTIEQLIQEQLGAMAFQIAALTAENGGLKERVVALEAQIPKDTDDAGKSDGRAH